MGVIDFLSFMEKLATWKNKLKKSIIKYDF
jgi:hypothetical protein